jgi:hypothetical protein
LHDLTYIWNLKNVSLIETEDRNEITEDSAEDGTGKMLLKGYKSQNEWNEFSDVLYCMVTKVTNNVYFKIAKRSMDLKFNHLNEKETHKRE